MKHVMIISSVILVLLVECGCSTSSHTKGKFSEEQMASIPMARRNDLPAPSGGLVLSVTGETITADEIIQPMAEKLSPLASQMSYNNFKTAIRPFIEKAVMNKVTDILLYNRALETAPDNIEDMLKKAVDTEVNQFVAGYGGNYADAQKAIERMGLDWEGYREYQKKFILTQSYISQQMSEKKPISHSDLLAYYQENKSDYQWEGYYEFSLIDLRFTNDQEKAEGLTKAEKILVELETGAAFSEMAETYSDGHRAGMGGRWNAVSWGSLAAPYDILERQVDDMVSGEIRGPIETDGHLFIVKLESKKNPGTESFDKVQDQIESEMQFQQQKETFNTMIAKLVQNASVADMDRFIDFCIVKAYRDLGRM